jgi:hypothetical protein
MSEEREYSVLEWLPDDRQRVMCFGYKTFCCKEDMEDEPAWYEVIFRFIVSSYRLKKEMPEDVEESVMEEIKVVECWDLDERAFDGHVIGVTKWKRIKEAQ